MIDNRLDFVVAVVFDGQFVEIAVVADFEIVGLSGFGKSVAAIEIVVVVAKLVFEIVAVLAVVVVEIVVEAGLVEIAVAQGLVEIVVDFEIVAFEVVAADMAVVAVAD